MPVLSTQSLAHIAQSVYKRVDGKVKQKRLNSRKRPVLMWLMSIMTATSFEGGSLTYKNQIESALQATIWTGDDEIEASEPDFNIDTTFGYFNFNVAVRILHDELRRLGYTILPNGSGNLMDRATSDDEKFKLVKYLVKLIEEARDAYDRQLDLTLHRSGAQSANAQPGIFGLLALDPTTGTIGGKNRADFPVLRNQVKTGMTTTAGGTFRADMDHVFRLANQFNTAGGVPGEIDVIFAGSAFIEGMKAYMEVNNLQRQAPIEGIKKMDSAIPDAAVYWDGIPVVWNPTMDALDALDVSTPTFTKQALALNAATWQFRNQSGLHKFMSSPPDQPNKRLTRQDLDGSYSLGLDAPASNLLLAVA